MIKFRNYINQVGFTEDYYKVRNFLIEVGYSEYTYVRWDWMATHGYLDKSAIGKIGIWEEENKIVGIATFDCQLGRAYCLALPEYKSIRKEIVEYSISHLGKDSKIEITVPDTDIEFQNLCAQMGFVASEQKEFDAIFYNDQTSIEYKLPEGFHITSMEDTFDLYQYRRILWKGFNHELDGEGELVFTEEVKKEATEEMIRPNVDLDLKIAVTNPDGDFVSYCGIWYDEKAGYAVVEPVATDPAYRKMGLGKAVVLEAIRRVKLLGAKRTIVGSGQQFYYSIGFRPYAISTAWVKNNVKG